MIHFTAIKDEEEKLEPCCCCGERILGRGVGASLPGSGKGRLRAHSECLVLLSSECLRVASSCGALR